MPWIRLCHPLACVCVCVHLYSPRLCTPDTCTCTRTRRQTAAYPPINLSAETQYGTPVAIPFTKFTYARLSCDMYVWKMTVVIGIPFRICPLRIVDIRQGRRNILLCLRWLIERRWYSLFSWVKCNYVTNIILISQKRKREGKIGIKMFVLIYFDRL